MEGCSCAGAGAEIEDLGGGEAAVAATCYEDSDGHSWGVRGVLDPILEKGGIVGMGLGEGKRREGCRWAVEELGT